MEYDLVVEKGRVIDPEKGTDAYLSIGIKSGMIAAISKEKLTGREVIDGSGCIVAPGFIDIHAHEDFALSAPTADEGHEGLPTQTADALLSSGVTTMVGGNCGIGAYPFRPYLERVQKTPFLLNYFSLIGYSSLRQWLGIGRYETPGPGEMDALKKMVKEGMELGFPGISFGLQYAPGTTGPEMLEMAKIVKEYDGFVAVHMRYDYPAKARETVEEMLEIAKATGVRLQLSHLAANVYGGDNLQNALQSIEYMNHEGFDIKGDMYPYDAWATGIQSAVFDGDPFNIYNFTYGDLEIVTGPWAGQRCTPELYEELRELTEDTTVVCHNATPWNAIEEALQNPFVFLGSDALMTKDRVTGQIEGHPRSTGTTARFLRLFVQDRGLLDLKTALRKMTIEPANRLKLFSKGRLQVGKDADITIFDLADLRERGEYGADACALPSRGIRYVVVGGRVVYTAEAGERFAREIAGKGKQCSLEGES
ncbi:MAG: amidohydrolase family protein [Peptococcaceae bacterium]